jgi:hypothetical protein
MSIPMVIRVKSRFGMSEDTAKRVRDYIEVAYNDAKERGVPLVVGEHCEALWPVERWEHELSQYDSHVELWAAIVEHEKDGWQVAAMDGGVVMFKRPARDACDKCGGCGVIAKGTYQEEQCTCR